MESQSHSHKESLVGSRKNITKNKLMNHLFSYSQVNPAPTNPSLRIIHDGKMKEFYQSFRTTIQGSIVRPESKLTSRKHLTSSQASKRQVIRPETSKKNRRLKHDFTQEKQESRRSESDLGQFEVQIRLNRRGKERKEEVGNFLSKISTEFRNLFAD